MSEPADIPPAAAVLEYATFDADGLPAWVPDAERLLDLRQPPRLIRKFFRNSRETAKYFAKSMRRRFSPDKAGDACAACGQSPCPTVVTVEWSTLIAPKSFEFKLTGQRAQATFFTHHTLCETCFQTWQRAGRRIEIAKAAFKLFRLVSILAIVMVSVESAGTRSPLAGLSIITVLWPLYFVTLIGSIWLIGNWRRRSAPRGVVSALPPGVRWKSLQGLDRRDRLALPALEQT